MTLMFPPGPGCNVDGNELTVNQPASAATEVRVRMPPPELVIGSVAVELCGLPERAAKESSVLPRLSCAGGEVTVRFTEIVWLLPAHAEDVQVSVKVPLYGDPAALNDSAEAFRPTDRTPGVPAAPVTDIQAAETAVENAMFCETTLEDTPIAVGDGGVLVPDVMANDALDAASTISGDAGRMVAVTPRRPVNAGLEESATVKLNEESPLCVGVPERVEPVSVRPAGSAPFTPNV